MTHPSARTLLPLVLAAALLAGCSDHPAPATPAGTTASTAYVAVARGRIDIEGGLLPLASNRAGVVAEVLVHAGDHVHKGQPLVRLQTGSARAAVDIARGQLQQAQAHAQLVAVKLKAARQHAKRLTEAAAAGAGAGQSADDAHHAVQQLEAERNAAQAAIEIARGQLEEARTALAQHTVRAPVSARITSLDVQPGEAVSAQSGALLTLLPDAPRIVVAELSSDFAGAVHAGMHAEVVLDNDSEQRVGAAHVVRVGEVFGPSTLEDDPALRANTRTIKCVLHFDKTSSLRIGQRVLVRILPAAHGR